MYLIFCLFFLLNGSISGQSKTEMKNDAARKPNFTYQQPLNCSPYTAILISNLQRKIERDSLKELYNLKKTNGEYYAHSFIVTNERFDKNKSLEYGVKLQSKAGNIYTAYIPVKQMKSVLLQKGIDYLDVGKKAKADLDNARAYSNVNKIHNGQNLSQEYMGEDIIVGIIDKGFDYTHPTFYNKNASEYRTVRVWEQGESGDSPSSFSYGNELKNTDEILDNENDGLDAGSHGTHVGGIAAGSGGLPDSEYTGVAYKSDIGIVATPNYYTAEIADGINYLFNYADQVNKPCVINMSIGGHIGPHDGTSTFDQYCDQMVGNGKILVGSSGNEGNANLHLDHEFDEEETIYSLINFPGSSNNSNGKTSIDIWGEEGSDLTFSINIYNTQDNEYEDYTEYITTDTDGTYSYTLQDSDFLYSDTCTVDIAVESSNPNNGKPRVYIEFDNRDQDESGDIYDYVELEIIGENTSFNAWTSNEGKSIFTNLDYSYPTLNGNTESTVGEVGGTGESIVSVGAYTTKNNYTDFQGENHSIISYAELGELAPFSSKGPTIDGRIKPDIVAPGNVIVSSVNSYDNDYTSNSNKVVAGLTNNSDDWWFATMQGTSMAAPMMTGIIALWLEANPILTPAKIKELIDSHAVEDNYTGNVPNYTWGHGKINAQNIMKVLENTAEVEEPGGKIAVYPNPSEGRFTLAFENYNFKNASVYDLSGKKVFQTDIPKSSTKENIDLKHVAKGLYILKLSGQKITAQRKLFVKN